jgi:hypothetical protein
LHTPIDQYFKHKGLIVDNVFLPLQLAPTTLNQPILPNWGFSLFSVNLGASSNPANEYEVLQNVGSYGKQLGHLAEALELVIKQLNLLDAKDLSQNELDVLQVFLGDVAAVRSIKNKEPLPVNSAKSTTTS